MGGVAPPSGVALRETPEILRGTELEAPALSRWTKATSLVLVAGIAMLADPIVFCVGWLLDDGHVLLMRHRAALVSTPLFTTALAMLVLNQARKSRSSGAIVAWAVLGSALNAGVITVVLAQSETSNVLAALLLGVMAIIATLPLSVPVGLAVGVVWWAMHRWERSLRRAPTQDARVRWLGAAALWLGVVGTIGELLLIPSLGYRWRSNLVEAMAWGPHLLLVACSVVSWVGAWRSAHLRSFLDDVAAGRVRGLQLERVDADQAALTAGAPDGRLVQAPGAGAFRTRRLELGSISRRGATRRMWALLLLGVVAATVLALAFVLAADSPDLPETRAPFLG